MSLKASELRDLFIDYEAAFYAPDRMEVHFGCGCGCGCGGDAYTSESWDAECEAAAQAIADLKARLQSLGVEWDLPE